MRNPAVPSDLTRLARTVMNTHARSFSSAALFLTAQTRADASLLYAFARAADDLCDEESLGPLAQRLQTFARLGMRAEQAREDSSSGSASASASDAMASAAGQVLRRHGVHPHVLVHFLQGLRDDTRPRQLQSTDDLLQFAFAVAGTVGQMMRPVLGAPIEVERYAIALGMAMQLTNVARDVEEDARRGRCYLPAQWDRQWRLDAGLTTAAQRTRAFAMVRRVLALADDFYAYAAQGLETIPTRNRRAIHIAIALYQGIGHKILRVGPEQYWEGRVHLSVIERSGRIVSAILRGGRGEPVTRHSPAAANFLQRQMMLQLQLQHSPAPAPVQFAT